MMKYSLFIVLFSLLLQSIVFAQSDDIDEPFVETQLDEEGGDITRGPGEEGSGSSASGGDTRESSQPPMSPEETEAVSYLFYRKHNCNHCMSLFLLTTLLLFLLTFHSL
jgi:hypothetical protein